jgi:hypothetical protein
MSVKNALGMFLLSLIVGASPAWADPWRGGRGLHEKVGERIQMMRMMKMTEALRMDRDQAARFFAAENQYEENKRRLRREYQEDVQRLRTILMRDTTPPERDLREIVSRIKSRKKEINDLSLRQTEETMNLLKLDQQARYIIFHIDFRREMEDLIREVREEKPPRPGPGK